MQAHFELGVWGGIVNRVGKNEFKIQSDGITHDMALAALSKEKVKLPKIDYNPNNWEKLVL